MQKIKDYFDIHKNPNVPFLFVGVVFVIVGIFLREIVWAVLAAVFIILSVTSYIKPSGK